MKLVGNKKVNITDREYDYYLQLVERFTDDSGNSGDIYFVDLFDTDERGFITLIRTEKSIPWAVLFYIQQIMINQRMRFWDTLVEPSKEALKKLKDLEERVERIESDNQPIGS